MKTGIDARAIEMAREEFARARLAAERTVTGEGHAKLAEQWSLFLHHANRVFTKLGKGVVRDSPAKGWWDRVWHTRTTDDLLRYIMHARNADEHGLRRITLGTAARPRGFVLGPFGIDRLVEPEATLMVAVYDRGVPYNPPTTHLGQPLNIERPNMNDVSTFMALKSGTMQRPEPFRVVSALAIDYMAKILEEAESFVAAPE